MYKITMSFCAAMLNVSISLFVDQTVHSIQNAQEIRDHSSTLLRASDNRTTQISTRKCCR